MQDVAIASPSAGPILSPLSGDSAPVTGVELTGGVGRGAD